MDTPTQPTTQPPTPFPTQPKRKNIRQLHLSEKLFLLTVEDESGTLASSAKPVLRQGLAGAILAELMQDGKSHLEEGRLTLLKPSPFGNLALDERMEKMATEEKPRKVKRWLEALNHKQTVKQIAGWLSDDQVFAIEEKKYVWITPFAGSSQPEATAKFLVKQHLRNIVLGGASAKADDLVLLRLLKACHLLKLIFTRDEYPYALHKVETLTASEVFNESMAKFLDDFDTYVKATQ